MISKSQFISLINVSNRDKRRKAVLLAIDILEHIRVAEQDNIDSFHLNFQDSQHFANAEYSLESVMDAISTLADAY
jgi:hypothetical protein